MDYIKQITMKNFLFLSSLCISFLSIGQAQEQKATNQKETSNPPVEVQKVSKVNKINKRIDTKRAKKVSPESTKTDKQ